MINIELLEIAKREIDELAKFLQSPQFQDSEAVRDFLDWYYSEVNKAS